ncbi:MAG: hypothetical protein H8M99_03665 [Gloeobacteraceae cyanobacterium ES-bin-144]|nr:hypothetical protein [Verrucomicrobiales bacterium]
MIFPDETHHSQHNEAPLFQRRRVIGQLGLAGLGMMASSTIANAATSGSGNSTPKVSVQTASRVPATSIVQTATMPDLPEEWAVKNSAVLPQYLRYLDALKLQRICPKQVIEAHAKSKGSVWNSLPPKAWWNRMGYVLKIVDRVAREMNVSEVEIISAYRCPVYNAHCEGAKAGSWHQANVAADVKFPVRASQVTATTRNLRDLGLFKGGVGGYWNFTHIDARGANVNW